MRVMFLNNFNNCSEGADITAVSESTKQRTVALNNVWPVVALLTQ